MDPAVVKKRGLFSSLKKRRITFTSELKLKIEREDRETTDGVVELSVGVVGSTTCLIVVSDTEIPSFGFSQPVGQSWQL